MRTVVATLALALLLAGCTAPPVDDTDISNEDALATQIAELDGTSAVDVQLVEYDDGRQAKLIVKMTVSDPDDLADRLASAAELVDDAPYAEFTRELLAVTGENLLVISEPGGTALDPAERAEPFTRWLSDPRVATISWTNQLVLQLVGDGTTDGSLIETVYSEMASAVTLADGGLKIIDPGSYSIATAQHPYSESRFEVAREIAALDGVSECSFALKVSSDSSFIHQIYCSVDGSAEVTGTQITALLDEPGLLESTEVRLQTADDSILVHEGTYVLEDG